MGWKMILGYEFEKWTGIWEMKLNLEYEFWNENQEWIRDIILGYKFEG